MPLCTSRSNPNGDCCPRNPGLDILLNPSLSIIEADAFSSCAITGTLVLPDALESIGESAFDSTLISSILFGTNLLEIVRSTAVRCLQGLLQSLTPSLA
jgi:hypothetical protein